MTMNKTQWTMCVGAALLAAISVGTVGTAAAGPADDLGTEMEAYANLEAYLGDSTSAESLADARKAYGSDCDALVAKAKKKLGASDEIVAWRLGDHPNARKVGDKYAVKVSDLSWFCDRYRARLDELSLRSLLKSADFAASVVEHGLSDEDKKNIRGGGNDQRKLGDDCLDMAAKTGAAADVVSKCEQLGKYADLLDAEWKIAAAEFEKPFMDAGITGDRLSWFVYYGPGIEVWYLKGCKGETSLAKIKKAKVLFQWLTDGNGVITIRRFAWKGDKLAKQTEKRYLTEKAAYRGCK
jgi:hypothetical protein